MSDLSETENMRPDALALTVADFRNCDNCHCQFRPRTKWQRFHSEDCRREFHRKTGDGGLRAVVSRASLLKGGEVSIVLRFGMDERERAQKITPGTVVEIV